MLMGKQTEQAVMDRVVLIPFHECWEWVGVGFVNDRGYGKVRWHGKKYRAHVLLFELHLGPVPSGLELDHVCRNRTCVNPEHLEPVTHRENLLRRWRAVQRDRVVG